MREAHDIIISPLVTEKSTTQREAQNQYSFKVNKMANKIEIKEAVERIFKVKVNEVRTTTMRGKVKRLGRRFGKRPDWKKAIVTVKEGDRIDFFEGA
ncbi:MAG: 50S ribosomal protein L23 [Syntrophobacterales bacterium]|nr:MAG: 50S ribosomal protein L23 [Syntrophobacterales bacterium]